MIWHQHGNRKGSQNENKLNWCGRPGPVFQAVSRSTASRARVILFLHSTYETYHEWSHHQGSRGTPRG